MAKTLPPTVGAGLSYQGPVVGVSTAVDHSRLLGTNVNASANAKVLESHSGAGAVTLQGDYSRRFGGAFGTSRPNYGGSIGDQFKF